MPEDKKSWLVYLLKCADQSVYTGITKDIKKRLAAHNRGIASRYTRGRLPVKLLAVSGKMDHTTALRREARIKKARKEKKLQELRKS